MITKIQLLTLPVSDQGRARAFYVDQVGFALHSDNPFMPDARWITVGPKTGETQVVLATWFPNLTPGGVKGTVLETDDLDGDHAGLARRGVAIGPVQDAPWGRYAEFDDPDGNGWVLQERAP